jgi:nicotinamidase-related amidase
MLSSKDVPLTESALLVVDAQESFRVGPRWNLRNNREFEANVGRLIDAYRAAKLPVVFMLHSDPDPGFEYGGPHYRLMDFIKPKPDEPVLHKTARNSFTGTMLQSLLLERGVRRLAITGISMEQCCETTTRVAADLGYAVDFVIDGTMTFPIDDPDRPGQSLSVDKIEERTVYALKNRFATVTTSADLVASLGALLASTH